ncbi:MAG: DUF4352 domain-containing protein [Bryobacterales bacterium]|nr:DUF4352 domain-containing protein [Bryobacterales bacterium]
MKQKSSALQARRDFLGVLFSIAGATIPGMSCKGRGKASNAMTFRMGERASAGKLVYLFTEASWKTTLGQGASARIPQHRFLLVNFSVTNNGGDQVAIPLLSLHDEKGNSYRELDSGEEVPNWMGLLRIVGPSETKTGAILFDAPLASYKLEITDGADIENELIAYVDIPLQMESDPVLAEPPALPVKPNQ